jgi:hypothetical protein
MSRGVRSSHDDVANPAGTAFRVGSASPLLHILSLMVGLSVLATVHPAVADPVHAAEEYRAGEDAYAHGAFRAAASAFSRAYEEDPLGASIYNAGVSWQAAGEFARAADDLVLALGAAGLPEAQRVDARKRLVVLEKQVSRIDVDGPHGVFVSVEHAARRPLPTAIHLAAGIHVVTATFLDGHTESRTITTNTGTPQALTFSMPSAPPFRESKPSTLPAPRLDSPSPGTSPVRTLGWVSGGGAVVAIGAAVVLGLVATGARNSLVVSGDTNESDYDRATTFKAATNVAWVCAGVLGAAGVSLLTYSFLHYDPASREPKSAFVLTLGALGASGRF